MGDCELIGSGLLAQPVNTLSSVAFLIAAIVVRDKPVPAAALAWVGLGSVMAHGWPGSLSSIVHDTGVLAAVGTCAVYLWKVRRRLPWPAIAVFAIGALIYALSRTDGPLCDPASMLQGHAIWHVAVAVAIVLLVAHENQTQTA